MAKGDVVRGDRGEQLIVVWDGAHRDCDADLLVTLPQQATGGQQRDRTGDAYQLKRREVGGIGHRMFGKVHHVKGAA